LAEVDRARQAARLAAARSELARARADFLAAERACRPLEALERRHLAAVRRRAERGEAREADERSRMLAPTEP
jgi:flagellar biosynthesis chaperone FliJ